ncbi:MAG: TetR family transcriptional regulator, partial [Pseudomonadota bacterium]|nr:TetR family transcriptional regulator [Pseudomonadota bacterium]
MGNATDTRKRLMDAAETVICAARGSLDISVRRIAAEAGTNVAAISYHFGSLEGLAVETARRVYTRLNGARLAELQAVADAAAPQPPALADTVRALIATSIRWSHDPDSPYAVFLYVNRLSSLSEHPDHFD